MSQRITTPNEYKAVFGNSDRRKAALECALDIRKFEIELYWKRATYFWTLIAATFAGYFALAAKVNPAPLLTFLVSCIGLVLSTGWYLVNRGSKYWQTNWERHVDSLEDDFMGPLYKTTISKEEFPWIQFWGGYPYSVSKVNQLISLFVVVVWLGAGGSSFLSVAMPSIKFDGRLWILAVTLAIITATFLVLLFCIGKSGPQEEPRRVDFRTSELAASDQPHGAQ